MVENYAFLRARLTDAQGNAIVGKLEPVAHDVGCSLAQLALAWCLKNPRVSTVITGATRVDQVRENMQAIGVVGKITPEVLARIETIVDGRFD
jgi:aryl-alcohol dehydrogenase-like predicted oxidoreductase